MSAILETKNLVKSFKTGDVVTEVLKGVTLSIERGEFVAIVGRSGAGKSTLLYQMGLLDEPTGGEVWVDGRNAHKMTEKEKMLFRLYKFGYVFQDYALLPELTAIENVTLPLLMEDYSREKANDLATSALVDVGLGHRLHNLPSQLSGGEQQRVSVARAIAERPEILFADEPPANLDRESSKVVLDILLDLHRKHNQTLIIVTHEEEYWKLAERVITIDDGAIVSIEKPRA